MRLYGDNPRIFDRTGGQTMLYLTCPMITSVDLAHCDVSRAKDWVFVDCGTIMFVSSNSRETMQQEQTI